MIYRRIVAFVSLEEESIVVEEKVGSNNLERHNVLSDVTWSVNYASSMSDV